MTRTRKRALEIAFPELPNENDVRMSWRNTDCPGDWKLTCGTKTFNVHRIIVMYGPRASAFLRANCNQSYKAGGSDLSELLPEPCWDLLETVLDYLYGDELPVLSEPTDVVRFLKIADVLQTKVLFDDMVARLNDQVEVDLEDLPGLLRLAWDMLPGTVAQGVLKQVARRFFLLAATPSSATELGALPAEVLAALLNHPDLTVRCEDDLFDFLTATNVVGRDVDPVPWWTCLRFEYLSPRQAAAADKFLHTFPRAAAMTALLRRREQSTGDRRAQKDTKHVASAMISSFEEQYKSAADEARCAQNQCLHSLKCLVISIVVYAVLKAPAALGKELVSKGLCTVGGLVDWRAQRVLLAATDKFIPRKVISIDAA